MASWQQHEPFQEVSGEKLLAILKYSQVVEVRSTGLLAYQFLCCHFAKSEKGKFCYEVRDLLVDSYDHCLSFLGRSSRSSRVEVLLAFCCSCPVAQQGTVYKTVQVLPVLLC